MRHKIGIVGGSGFIGFSLAKYLSEKFRVRIIDVKAPSGTLDNVEFHVM